MGLAGEHSRGFAPPLMAHVLLDTGGFDGLAVSHAAKVRFHWLSGVGGDLDEP